MNIEAFENKLNELNLTKKEFASMVGAVYNGVVNWNSKEHTPKWVDSWLINYEKAKAFDELLTLIKKYDKIKDYK